MSFSLLKGSWFCFAAAWEGFWDNTLLCGRKSNLYVELCELLNNSELLYPICKMKRRLFCFVSSVTACVWTLSSLGYIFLIGYCPLSVLRRISVNTNNCQVLSSFRKTFLGNWCSNTETISASTRKQWLVILQEYLRVCILSSIPCEPCECCQAW